MYTEMYHNFWLSSCIYLSTRIIVEDSEFGPETGETAYDMRQWLELYSTPMLSKWLCGSL